MSVQRYIEVKVADVGGKIVPATELQFQKGGHGSDYYTFNNIYSDRIYGLIDMVWDTKKKEYRKPIVVDIKRNLDETYKIGDVVYVDKGGLSRKLIKSTIKEIIYEEYSNIFKKYRKLDGYEIPNISKELKASLLPEDLIEFRHYEPTYVFDNGHKTKYVHQMYRIDL